MQATGERAHGVPNTALIGTTTGAQLTARVVGDGFVVLHDPSGLLTRLVGAVAGPS